MILGGQPVCEILAVLRQQVGEAIGRVEIALSWFAENGQRREMNAALHESTHFLRERLRRTGP
jgi:hypothetical protein